MGRIGNSFGKKYLSPRETPKIGATQKQGGRGKVVWRRKFFKFFSIIGASVGELMAASIQEQLHRIRGGDRFWYENPEYFTTEEIETVHGTEIKVFFLPLLGILHIMVYDFSLSHFFPWVSAFFSLPLSSTKRCCGLSLPLPSSS
jgi:hypothetical protein